MRGLNTKKIGDKGEHIAAEYLKGKGYKIIARNVHIGDGEIDIIAQDGDNLVFVEVKTRYSYSYGNPLEAITKDKIKHIIRSAKMYISSNHLYNMQVRFDVIGTTGDEIEHIKDAFWLNWNKKIKIY